MEKISKGKHFDYPITRFSKEDFIKLVKIFTENCSRCEIIVEDYKLNSITDFDEIPYEKSVDFKLTGYEPYITLQGYYAFTQLYLSDIDNVVQQGIKSKIDTLFEKNKSIWAYFEYLVSGFIKSSLIGIIIAVLIVKFSYIGIFCAIIIGILWVCTGYMSLKRHTIVYLKTPVEKLSFWERNGELIIVTIIATIIAGLSIEIIKKFI